MEKEIYKSQIDTINLAKKYLKHRKKIGVDISISPFCDFVIWADCIGNEKIKLIRKKKYLSFDLVKNFIKEILSIFINSNYKLISSKLNKKKKYNIIYSYCSKENFEKNGSFNDRYFNYKSNKKKNIYWFLISLDNYIPAKIKNISIVYKEKGTINFLNFLKIILKNLCKKNFLDNTNYTTFTSNLFANYFYKTLKYYKFNVYLPYENRPHQNAVIKVAKQISKKNKIFGYYHRMPEPLQLEMIYKSNFLDKLYVCSEIQKKVFHRYFSWPSKKLEVINSIRYLKFRKRKDYIFLPYSIKNQNFFIEKLKTLLMIKNSNIKKHNISIHYLNKKNKKHINFKDQIKKISIKNNKKLDAPVILGEAGSVASEMLDTTGKVYHISNRNLNIFSQKIWKNIKVKKISESIFEYKKLTNKKLLNINGKKNNFNNILTKNKF